MALFVPACSLLPAVARGGCRVADVGESLTESGECGEVAFAFALFANFSRWLAGFGAEGADGDGEGSRDSPHGSASQSAPFVEEDAGGGVVGGFAPSPPSSQPQAESSTTGSNS